MAKRDTTLEEAKVLLGNDNVKIMSYTAGDFPMDITFPLDEDDISLLRIFLDNYSSSYVIDDTGKYHSGIKLQIPKAWNIDKNQRLQNPIKYRSCNELTDGMGIDFDGDVEFLLGNFLKYDGVFVITNPKNAHDVLIKVSWGDSFSNSKGNPSDYAEEIGANYFSRKANNSGTIGYDYWILPVNFSHDMNSRDVSGILQRLEDEDKKEEAEIDSYLHNQELDKEESIRNKDRILEQINPIIERVLEITELYKFKTDEATFTYQKQGGIKVTRYYNDELISELNEILKLAPRQEYEPDFRGMEEYVAPFGLTFIYDETGLTVLGPSSEKYYEYSIDGYHSLYNDLLTFLSNRIDKKEETKKISTDKNDKEADDDKKYGRRER